MSARETPLSGEQDRTVICLLCEYGLCAQGCWATTCQCPSTLHRGVDYEAERPRTSPAKSGGES